MQACREAGITVRPRTEAGRDAMLLAATEAAAERAMRQRGGEYSAEFITGLAGALGACALSQSVVPAAHAQKSPSLLASPATVSANHCIEVTLSVCKCLCWLAAPYRAVCLVVDWDMHTNGCW